VHIRTLKMNDDVLSVRYSPNGKLLAVSLLDSTVKVFHQDTLKFFLSLYGHKVSHRQLISSELSMTMLYAASCSCDGHII
jgi:U3 small nucleolar RNA-associated protein 12